MVADMFVQARSAVSVPFQAASDFWPQVSARLAATSNEAYEAGVTVFARVGPFGDLPGLSKEVRLQMCDPVTSDTRLRVPLRWIATGASGHLFPALDADLELAPLDGATCELQVTATYQPPFGAIGARLDQALLRLAAEATMRSFLYRLARILDEAGCASQPGAPVLAHDTTVAF